MELWDYILTGAALTVALWYLYRRIVVTRGCSCGSSSCHTRSADRESLPGDHPSGPCSGCGENRDRN